jgi:tetratricopeptide (TPR) repeat protein
MALAHSGLSNLLLMQGETEQAELELERSLALLAPGGPEARGVLEIHALHCEHLGRLEPALAETDRALECEPDRIGLLFLRARLLRKLERPREAEATLGRVLDLDPDQPEARRLLGL